MRAAIAAAALVLAGCGGAAPKKYVFDDARTIAQTRADPGFLTYLQARVGPVKVMAVTIDHVGDDHYAGTATIQDMNGSAQIAVPLDYRSALAVTFSAPHTGDAVGVTGVIENGVFVSAAIETLHLQ